MNLNHLIIDTLKPLNIPVARARYNQPADTFIVFLEYNQAPRMSADDEEIVTKYFYQVDIFSKGNFDDLVKEVRNRLTDVGFRRMFESETYDEDMGYYRSIMRFNFENNIGVD